MSAQPPQPTKPYVRRFTRINAALDILADHPRGLSLTRLADLLGANAADLREEILAFYTAEAAIDTPLSDYRDTGLQFVSGTGEEVDPQEAEVVVLSGEPRTGLGIHRLTEAQMALLWRSGHALLTLEPDNTDLADALTEIGQGWLTGGDTTISDPGDDWVADFKDAAEHRRVVHIEYSRAWRPGVFKRDIHPYRVVAGIRGWEVDAGPLDENDMPRTYLLANVRAMTVTGGMFERPADIESLIAANRAETQVRMVLPQDSAWAADRLAERVTTVASDAEDVTVRLQLTEPVRQRVGLIIVATAGKGFVVDPPELAGSGAEMAQHLLDHHNLQLP